MQLIQIVTLVATVLTAGWFAAFITNLIKREGWASWIKLVLALVIAALVGLATAYLTGDVTRFVTLWKAGEVTAEQVMVLGALIFASSSTWFQFYFKGEVWAENLAAWPSKKE